MARTGRPATPPAIVDMVRELLWAGFTRAAIVAELNRLGKRLSARTVTTIDERLGPRDPRLAEGEEWTAPVRCDLGHLVTILPCRSCAQMPNRLLLDRLAAAELTAEKAGFSLNPPRRKRTRRPYEILRTELKPAQQKRLEAVRELRAKRRVDEG